MKSLIPVLAFSSLLLAAAPAFAQGSAAAQAWKQLEQDLGLQTVYSVDMVTQVNQTNLHSRMVRNGDRSRTEMAMPLFNIKIITLEIPAGGKTVSYALFPDKKKYAVDEGAAEALASAAPPRVEELGTETHEGVVCIKRRVTDVRKNFRNEMTVLFSPDQKNMPVKMTINAATQYAPGQPSIPSRTSLSSRTTTSPPPTTACSRSPPITSRPPACKRSCGNACRTSAPCRRRRNRRRQRNRTLRRLGSQVGSSAPRDDRAA